MLAETNEAELFELVREDVVMAAARDLYDAPPWEAWNVITARRSANGDALIVAGTPEGMDHACVLFPAASDGGEAAIVIRRATLYLGENDYLGLRRFKSEWLTPHACGVLATAFRPEKGATAIGYVRGAEEHLAQVDPTDSGRCVIIDWTNPEPITAFTEIHLGDRRVPAVLPDLPFSPAAAAEAFDAYWRNFEAPEAARHEWISQAFYELEGEAFQELTFQLLHALDARRHPDGLAHLGAGPIYGNGHWFYDRLQREPGTPPENLLIALSMERPEFLPQDVAERYTALMERLKRQTGN